MESQESHHTQSTPAASSNSPAQRRPLSMAPRATTSTAAFDLESTLKDLEDTFYNGLEGGSLKRTTSIITWPKDNPPPETSKTDDVSSNLIDILK